MQTEFSENLVQQLKTDGVAPELLCVEVTEFSLVSDSLIVDLNLKLLSDARIRINIDDFGTGYSSLSYLPRMASDLELDTVAEGIENQQQYDFLRDNGCKMGQGFYMSRPVQASELLDLRDRPLI